MIKKAKILRGLYEKLFLSNDTPHKIALGMAIGVSAGIMPGTGPIAALFLALAFRANRASALLGSLLTNTWMGFFTFALAVKLGSFIFSLDWYKIHEGWTLLWKNFHWQDLLTLSILQIVFPVIIGYLVISLCLGLAVYVISLIIIALLKKRQRHIYPRQKA